jgi:hypothetical protein
MLRLSLVFLVWVASTAYALDRAADHQEAEMQQAYLLAWNEADDDLRTLLQRSQHAWQEYRDANCRILGEDCYGLMAQERTAELRYIVQILTPDEDEAPCGLTNTNVRTILRADARAADRRSD